MRTFNVDMIPGGSQTAVACNQYEKGDIWVFALYYDGGRYDIPAGATVSITGQKSDGTAFNVPASVSDNTVLVTVTEQMTAAYGKCIAEVLVQSGNTTLYTANFYILVEPAAVQVPLADTTLPLSITAQDGTVYVQSDLEEATEQMIALAAQQQYQQDLAAGVAQRTVEQYNGSTLAGKKQTVKAAIDELNSTTSDLDARIDNIIAPGGAPSEAEIVDARLGADGVTYPTLGDAIRTQFTDVKSELSQLDSTVNGEDIPITFIANEYINSSNGTFVSYNGWSRSNLIDCSMVDSIIYTNTGRPSAYNAFYDGNGEFISAFNIQQTQTGNYPKPANAKYFAYSNYTADVELFTWVNKPVPQGGLVADVDDLDERVTALETSQGSAPEITLPPYAVAVVGHEFNMYTENVVICDNINNYIWAWDMRPYATQYNQYDDRFSVIPAAGSERTYTLSLTCIDPKTGATITSASMSLIVVSDSAITGKKMLMIGDSLTASGYSAYELQHVLSSGGVESLGTITATPWIGNVQKTITMEGRGGWSAYDYMHTASKNGNTNAFLNPSTNLFDFSYYMTQQGYSDVDIVMLNLGTNGTEDIQRDVEAMGQIIASIHSYDANVPVVVHLTPPPATQNGWTYINHGAGAEEFRLKTLAMVKAQIEAFGNKQSEKTYISCVYGCLDRYHDFAYREEAVSQRNPFTVTRQIQNVHPASYGYYKFADVYWGMIEHLLS